MNAGIKRPVSRHWHSRAPHLAHFSPNPSAPRPVQVYPSRGIRIDFKGEPIELEELYEALRTYGTISRYGKGVREKKTHARGFETRRA